MQGAVPRSKTRCCESCTVPRTVNAVEGFHGQGYFDGTLVWVKSVIYCNFRLCLTDLSSKVEKHSAYAMFSFTFHLNFARMRRKAERGERYRPPPTTPSFFPGIAFVHGDIHIADTVELLPGKKRTPI